MVPNDLIKMPLLLTVHEKKNLKKKLLWIFYFLFLTILCLDKMFVIFQFSSDNNFFFTGGGGRRRRREVMIRKEAQQNDFHWLHHPFWVDRRPFDEGRVTCNVGLSCKCLWIIAKKMFSSNSSLRQKDPEYSGCFSAAVYHRVPEMLN